MLNAKLKHLHIMQLSAGEIWRNAHHLAFTNQTGGFLSYRTATTRFHDAAVIIGLNQNPTRRAAI